MKNITAIEWCIIVAILGIVISVPFGFFGAQSTVKGYKEGVKQECMDRCTLIEQGEVIPSDNLCICELRDGTRKELKD